MLKGTHFPGLFSRFLCVEMNYRLPDLKATDQDPEEVSDTMALWLCLQRLGLVRPG